ncbi:MAG: hypothetical protein RL507_1006, partial [Actinomycetota bacterium]
MFFNGKETTLVLIEIVERNLHQQSLGSSEGLPRS